jgi:hypothetical protein
VGRNDELEKAKARAWYLDPKPLPEASTSKPRQPRFTTFDPESTRSDAEVQHIEPLPSNATSPILVQLHDHLTKQSDSVDAGSVRFLHTPSSKFLAASPEGQGEGVALLGESGGTNWEWVVTCQVKGRGRGVLNRAEKEIRKWVGHSPPKILLQALAAWYGLWEQRLMIDARNVRPTHTDKNSIKGRKRYGLVNRLHRPGRMREPIHSRREGKVEFGGAMAVGPYSAAGVEAFQNEHIHNCTTDISTYAIMIPN